MFQSTSAHATATGHGMGMASSSSGHLRPVAVAAGLVESYASPYASSSSSLSSSSSSSSTHPSSSAASPLPLPSKCQLDLQEHKSRIYKTLAERQAYQAQHQPQLYRAASSASSNGRTNKYLAINPTLLEPVYSDEVVAYMAEMEVGAILTV